MAWLNEAETQKIADYITQNGLRDEGLYTDLLDHLCCMTEALMEKGEKFDRAMEFTCRQFSGELLQEIQDTKDELFNLNYKTMNRNTFITGLVAGSLICTGSLFKFMHWPGAGASILAGIFLLIFGFIPLMFIQAYRVEFSKAGKAAQIAGLIAVNLALAGFVFKLFHWPYALMLFGFALAVAVLIYLPLLLYKNSLELSTLPKNRFVSVVFLLVLGGVTLLGLRSSSNKADLVYTTPNGSIENINEQLKTRIKAGFSTPEIESRYNAIEPMIGKIKDIKIGLLNALKRDESAEGKSLSDLPYSSSKMLSEADLADLEYMDFIDLYESANSLLANETKSNEWVEKNIKHATVSTAYTHLSILEMQLYQYCLIP